MENEITLIEYAKLNKIDSSTARKKAAKGGFKTAYKKGRDWVIDKNEPYTDNRIKSGKYIKNNVGKSVDK